MVASPARAISSEATLHSRRSFTISSTREAKRAEDIIKWDAIHDVNLRGAFLVLREAIPILRRGTGGSIVLIGSINGSRGKRGTAAYSASKAG